MKVIITGASGFIGNNLSSYLQAKGFQIERLSLRSNWTLPAWGAAIIHLAGKAHDTANTAAEEEYYKINTELTHKVFKEFLRSDIRDFFFFSSVKAAADTLSGILTEEHPSDPQTPYGKSKLLAEKDLISTELPDGKRLFIIRPCMVHGPGNKGNLNLLYSAAEKGIPWPLASFENSRSFLGIDNLNFLIEKMLTTELPSGIYNFADDEPLSTTRLITLIAETGRKKPVLLRIPAALISGAAKMGDILGLPLNSERLKKLTESYVVSNARIKSALDIDQLPFDTEAGLIKTIKSFRK